MNQVYKMVNGTMTGTFEQFSPVVADMDDAREYFKQNFAVEYPGSSIIQIEGINPAHGANFSMNTVWATQSEADAFLAKYGYVPESWDIFTLEEQNAMMQAEWEKEERKSRY